MSISTEFDYWADVNPGHSVWEAKGSNDPDGMSKPLQRAHQMLWSKPLPAGPHFDLKPAPGTQLQWGTLRLSSDSISNSYMTNSRMRQIVLQAGQHAEELFRCGSKLGAYILFPAQRVNGKPTINGARGMCLKIGDRMDLTLETIRRHYIGEKSPLTDTLSRYETFFSLFSNFKGYVDFWLLNELVDEQYAVDFWLPFDDFHRNGPPTDLGEYLQLKTAAARFLDARTARAGLAPNYSFKPRPLRGSA